MSESKKLSKSEQSSIDTFGTNKSAKIRFLTSLEWTRSEIANFLGIRYQFVRNVQVGPVPKT